MQVALCQLNYKIGHIEENQQKILAVIQSREYIDTRLFIFSELSVCGYPPKDLLLYPSFVKKCHESVLSIAKQVLEHQWVCIGAPLFEEGRLYNALLVLHDGKVLTAYKKQLLPTYDVFDERRYFSEGDSLACIEIEGITFALSICEDIWFQSNKHRYFKNPMEDLKKHPADYLINISASPFSLNHAQERLDLLQAICKKYEINGIYVNQVGANTDLLFDGTSMIIDKQGELLVKMNSFEEQVYCFDPMLTFEKKQIPIFSPAAWEEQVIEALEMGIRDFFSKNGFSKAVLGLSGGIDSAMVLYLAQRALGSENVVPILMPSEFSSKSSITDSIALCEKLDVSWVDISIKSSYQQLLQLLDPHFKDKPRDVTEENIQARIRGILLMAMANKHGYILLNTTNKSEAAVGYGTLYGDLCGALSVLGDVYKSQVYSLARYINRDNQIIPENIINKAPSAELKPNQKDSDSLPDYAWLDQVLYDYLECFVGLDELVDKYGQKEQIISVLQKVTRNEYKRYQMAPVIRVSDTSFGDGRNMPLVGQLIH